MNRECRPIMFSSDIYLHFCLVNRFAGTRIEDLQGEIPAPYKNQHKYQYLQKKLSQNIAT
jgi:hypothetical protein